MKLLKYTPAAFDRAERELRQAAARCLSVYEAGNSITAELSCFEDTFCGELPQTKQSFAPLREDAELLNRLAGVLSECMSEYEAAEQLNEDGWWQTAQTPLPYIAGFLRLQTELCGDITII